MSTENRMILNGRDASGEAVLTYGLADDYLEVRGFGQPVTEGASRKMVDDYHEEIKAAYAFFEQIETDDRYVDLKNNSNFSRLKTFLNKDSQVVSGVFGKEIILQILAQRNCEGIRYVVGVDRGKNTIILTGVEEVPGETMARNGVVQAKSKPVSYSPVKLLENDQSPLKAEVHLNSYTLKDFYGDGGIMPPAIGLLSDKVFGTF